MPVAKENRQQNLDWRKRPSRGSPRKKSLGVTPQTFHGGQPKPGQSVVAGLHEAVQSSLLLDGKRKVLEEQQTRRSAYKKVTALRNFPIQSAAFRFMDQLSGIGEQQQTCESTSDSGSSSSSSGLSSASSTSSSILSKNEEPKRLLTTCGASPAQSRLKNQHRNEFLKESELLNVSPDDASFGCPLWSMEPRVFSIEKAEGKRKYVVGQLGRIIDHYWRKTDPRSRFMYELVRENTPCRLYFDLEFSKQSNNLDDETAEALLVELFEEVLVELKHQFGIEGIDRSNLVDLEATTTKKFSRHWIFHLPKGFLFRHTGAVGHFVQDLVSRLAGDQATGILQHRRPLLHAHLLVKVSPSNVDADKLTCFIDTGVYTKNRLFRVLGSSKFGKPPEASLRIATTNSFRFPKGFENSSFYLPDILQLKETIECRNLEVDDVNSALDQFVQSNDWEQHAEALAQTLVVPCNSSKISYPILPYKYTDQQCTSVTPSDTNKDNNSRVVMSVGQTSFPTIDAFVLNSLAIRGGVHGSIRAWSLKEDASGIPTEIRYQMSRNRWCERIGRCHKSNNICWNVDLQLWRCVQSCFDPDCQALGFRGTPVSLPDKVREQAEDVIFEYHMAAVDEAALVARGNDHSSVGVKGTETVEVEKAFESMTLKSAEDVLTEPTVDFHPSESNSIEATTRDERQKELNDVEIYAFRASLPNSKEASGDNNYDEESNEEAYKSSSPANASSDDEDAFALLVAHNRLKKKAATERENTEGAGPLTTKGVTRHYGVCDEVHL